LFPSLSLPAAVASYLTLATIRSFFLFIRTRQ